MTQQIIPPDVRRAHLRDLPVIMDRALAVVRGTQLLNSQIELPDALLIATRVTFEAHHTKEAQQIRKSAELTPLLTLLTEPALFPPGRPLVEERIALLVDIIDQAPQRPVVAAASLALLDLQLREKHTIPREALERALATADHPTIPLLALCLLSAPDLAEQFTHTLRKLPFVTRKTRLGELTRIVDAQEDSPELDQIVAHTYEAIFEGTTQDERMELAMRVIREFHERDSFMRHDRWHMLVDPLISQNLDHPVALKLLELVTRSLPHDNGDQYMTTYLMVAVRERVPLDDAMLTRLAERGSREVIRYLYPSTQLMLPGGVFQKPQRSPYALKVQGVVDQIIARHGLSNVGGELSVAQGSGGELSVFEASHGSLSVSERMERHVALRDITPQAPLFGGMLDAAPRHYNPVALTALVGVIATLVLIILAVLFGG